MLVIGLTGSIGMGKSTAAARFRHNGVAVFDADAAVHDLYAGEAVPLIEKAFPGTTSDGTVDRQRLMAALIDDAEAIKRLEGIIHPMVREMERQFLAAEFSKGAVMAVLEIPLLFETGAHETVDVTVVVSTDAQTQRERVMKRPGMTDEKFAAILARQLPDDEKRRRADEIVDTSRTIPESDAQIDKLVRQFESHHGTAYHRYWKDA